MNKDKRLDLIISAFFLAFKLMVYGPIELYLSNINEFSFSLSMFWFIPVTFAILSVLLLYFIGCHLRHWVQNLYIGILFGIGLMLYIQSNFLNLKVGIMNGAQIDWNTYGLNFLINLAIWICVISVMMCGYYEKNVIFRKLARYISGGLMAVQLVTLITILLTVKSDIDKDGICQYISDKGIYEVSSDENIIVFILDMFDDDYFKQILAQEPEISNQFVGFTQYTNSTGNYSTTSYSIGTLLTGQYLRNSESSFYEEVSALYENCSLFNELAENNYRLDIYTYDGMMPEALKNITSNYVEGRKSISDYFQFSKTLYQLVICKYFPNFMKQYAWMDGTEFNQLVQVDSGTPHNIDNINFYNEMTRRGITVQDDKKCFKFIHIDGTHYPYTMNENIEPVEENGTSDINCARGVIKIVQKYMDGMKEAGVYDSSSIIIMADHGYYWGGTLCNPVLLVKPQNSEESMKVSNAPVSHHDFQPTIRKMAGLDCESEDEKSFLDIGENETRERLFYQYYLEETNDKGKNRLIEYAIDSASNQRKSFHLTGNEYTVNGELINHFEHCKYCQSGQTEPNDNKAQIIHR